MAVKAPTVRDETIDDVDAAVALLRLRKDIDPRRIIVVGHSLGATLAPRIAAGNASVSAIVMLAATARPLPSVAIEQIEYVMAMKGVPTPEQRSELEKLKHDAARAQAARPGDEGREFMNVPLSWWADLNVYDPVATSSALSIPVLVLQGGRDYQVTRADYELFHRGLTGRKNVEFHLFPELNHLFMSGAGVPGPAEYDVAGHIDIRVINAIADFARRF